MVLDWWKTDVVVRQLVAPPVDVEPNQAEAGRLLGKLPLDRPASDKGAVVAVEAAKHPSIAELDRGGPLLVDPSEAARLVIDLDEQQPGLDARHVHHQAAVRHNAAAGTGLEHRVPYADGIAAFHPNLVAEVSGVSGAGDHH